MTVLTIPVMGPDGQPAANPRVFAQLTDFTGVPVFAGTQNSVPTAVFASTANSQTGILEFSLPGNDIINCGGSANTTWTLNAYWAPGQLSWSKKYYITGDAWNYLDATPIAISPTGNLIPLAPPPEALLLNSTDSQTLVVASGKELDLQGNVLVNGVAPVPSTLTINGKPLSAPVTLAYNDLTNLPTIPTVPVQSVAGRIGDITLGEADIANLPADLASKANVSSLAPVATSGRYTDLTGTPTIPAAQVNTDWNSTSGTSQILNKPDLGTAAFQPVTAFDPAGTAAAAVTAIQTGLTSEITRAEAAEALKANTAALAPVALSGNYNDLLSKPAIPTIPPTWDWSALTGIPAFAPVATSGSYNDLSNKPTIPAAQVSADWNADSGAAQILNKPSIPTIPSTWPWSGLTGIPNFAAVATSGNYNDLSNKPAIPTIPATWDWSALTDVPALFPPSAHTHQVADVTNFPTTWAWSALAGVPAFAPVATSGAYSDLTGSPTLGSAATLNVGNAPGTVAAGNDPRFQNAYVFAVTLG
jgi:hypothetical protein